MYESSVGLSPERVSHTVGLCSDRSDQTAGAEVYICVGCSCVSCMNRAVGSDTRARTVVFCQSCRSAFARAYGPGNLVCCLAHVCGLMRRVVRNCLRLKVVRFRRPSHGSAGAWFETRIGSYLVDPASSHMLVSKIKPCMSKYKPR